MPPVRFLPGTKVKLYAPGGATPAQPGERGNLAPGDFTDAQYEALEGLKQTNPPLKFGAARPEFVNQFLLADGTLSTDRDAVSKAAANQSPVETGNLWELNAHLAENRFLIVVDCDLVPRCYFQCATPGNPDVELA
jgi:hypothetical protein